MKPKITEGWSSGEEPLQAALSRTLACIFGQAAYRWDHQQDVSRYLNKIGGRIIGVHQAVSRQDEGQVVILMDHYPFLPDPDTVLIDHEEEDEVVAIEIPREMAERIVILGYLP